ncbi:hypothetical protein ACS0TY_011005 [Phlomoides rotata]
MLREKTMIPMNKVLLKYYLSSPTKKSMSKNSFARQRLQRSYYAMDDMSCSKCFRKMKKANSSLNCSNCNDSHSVGVLRFRLEVEVDDGRDCTTFVIFDKDAKQLTTSTAAENGEAPFKMEEIEPQQVFLTSLEKRTSFKLRTRLTISELNINLSQFRES